MGKSVRKWMKEEVRNRECIGFLEKSLIAKKRNEI